MSSDAFVEQITYPNTMGYVKRIIGLVPIYWSLFHPVLEPGELGVALPLHIPEDTRPFLDEGGGRCDPATRDGKQTGGKPPVSPAAPGRPLLRRMNYIVYLGWLREPL